MIVLLIYIIIFIAAFIVVRLGIRRMMVRNDFTSLKTVTFGDESAVRPDRWASFFSVFVLFLLWGAFTGSNWVPIHAPGPFVGNTKFTYTMEAPNGVRDDATVYAHVFPEGQTGNPQEVEPGAGFAKNDSIAVAAWRSYLVRIDKNDEITREDGARVVEIDGQPVSLGSRVEVDHGTVTVTSKGSLSFAPYAGMQMEPIWLPSPEMVVARIVEISIQGYQPTFPKWPAA
ncbi:hypothetical protein G5V65_20965 [Rhodobacter sp. HX-7-19]|uniref:Uncharacterized protein n=1 Tax=Paragemmobacter kunshanensis TaxID=2583234 RepID=A0A6M1UBP2_9RHOB|nr:hypothetical protein [Rhodobacter kunshanensis]NGQ93361.1 hypothetical protein [Rhodobacter kunshanensis]